MTFDELLDRVIALLQREGRVSYRALKRRFALDDDYVADLTAEIIDAKRLAIDEENKVLVWTGGPTVVSAQSSVASPQPLPPSTQPPTPRLQTSDLGLRTSDFPGFWTPPHLADRIRAEQAALEARGATDGERKTITALFADIKGSMALMETLDPEDARSLIDPVLTMMMDAVHRYEGYVVQSTGDGIFAFFGAPLAHEDHPQRALYAALRMQEDIGKYADTLRLAGRSPVEIRVGVNTGEVVLRSIRKDDLRTEYTPIGHSTGLAQRMESLAKAGSIVVSEHTYKLTAGYFEFKPLGAAQVKGVSEPIPLYEVRGVGPLRTRLQVAAQHGLTRFVGRQTELEQLRRALEQAKARHGQIVGVMGEPGVGKSRLFYEFKLTSQGGCLVLEAYSVSHGKASPYVPVIELLKTYFQLQPHDDERQRQEKVTGKVLTLDRSLEDILPYLFTLLGIADPTAALQQMDPQIRRRRTFEALKRLFLRESLKQPLLLIFEDLHWIDTETQGFLEVLSESVASARILLLVNYRPEYRHEWNTKTYYTQLHLAPLGKDDAEELLTFLLGNDPSLISFKHLILEKTEGTPFFMEEVVQTLIEEGVLGGERGNFQVQKVPTELHLSPTVQGILSARIDRLRADEKALLQQLAVIGREFPLSLIRHVVPQPEEELYRLLAALQSKEFLYEQPAFPEVEYTFKHALTQEVAYNSVLQERRKTLHERTAQAIERLYGASLEDHYSELAHHYRRSGNTQKAVEYLHLTGQQAIPRSAYAEAISHLTTALELLKTMPESPKRIQQELALQTLLGPVLMVTKGQSAPETGAAFSRAYDLCRQVEDTPHLFSVLAGLRRFYSGRRELQTARKVAQQMLNLAQHAGDPALLVEAHHALGNVLFWSGEFVAAQAQVEQGIACHDPQQHRSLAFLYGMDSGVNCRNFAANVLWLLGYPDRALKRSPEALSLAQELAHPHSQGFALLFAVLLHQYRREGQATQERAEALIALATERGFPQLLAAGTVLRGWALAAQGQADDGITQMQQGMAAIRATGAEALQPYYKTLLAEAYEKAGQIEEGLSVLVVEDESEESLWEAELYRLKGELTLQQFNVQGSTLRIRNWRPKRVS
ncbi:MAG: AAA family ATPase [Deltaproteobacteria bacterium]|nr:AAA family ATPase [Deltaproteobacteria bacterium]